MTKFRALLLLLVTLGLGSYWGLQAIERSFEPAPEMVDAQADDNYSLVEKGLYVGGFVGKPPPGVVAVLNVCTFKDEYRAQYHEDMPIRDAAPAPSIDWLRDAVQFVEEHRGKDRHTYVHCYAGISRSAMVTAAYLMKKHNWSRDEALAVIRKSRPIISPNPAFMERLAEWEKARR
jgi:hypothetical protein